MKQSFQIETDPKVEAVFKAYPDQVKNQMLALRTLVFQVAEESEEISKIEETLKWGEPSYLCKNGSTLRMDWKAKSPDQYALYFKCTSRLVETFKTVFGDQFNYEGNRAIVFQLDEKIPEKEVKLCIEAALNYHKVKKHPTLGI